MNRMIRMNRGKRQRQLIYLSMVCGLSAWIAAACASAPPPPVPSPTPTTQAMGPTATPPPGIQLLNISVPAAPGILVPSPDGTRLAGLNASLATLTIYDLTGEVQGQYTASTGQGMNVAWLPDSSALFAWEGNGTASGPLVIVDRQGRVQMTGADAGDPFLSPDGQWVAATHFTDSIQQDEAEVLPRAGGAARMLAQGADVLGWQGNHVIYWAGGSIYTVAPTGGTPLLLAQVPGGEYFRPIDGQPLGVDPATSPDGQVLIVDGVQDRYWMLVGTHVQRLPTGPTGAIDAFPVFWAGPHQVVGRAGGNLVVLDLISGAVVHDTGYSDSDLDVAAVAGDWIAGTARTQTGLSVINTETKVHVVLNSLPISTGSGKVFSLGQGKFLVVYGNNAGAEAYIVDPALASGG